MHQFEDILQKALKLRPALNRERLAKAYKYTEELTCGIYRLSGDPYVSHPLAIFEILLAISPDEDTLVAGLLHGISTSSKYNEDEVKDLFGENIVFLNSAVDNLKKVRSRDENTEAESIRGMFVTMAKDLRVILIKLADRLHNMRTIHYHTLAKQKLIAKETLDIYVPISARLGIYSIKGKLEDLAFKTLYSSQYDHLKSEMDEYLAERKSTINDIKEVLSEYFENNNIKADVEGRIKNLYSIYRKMKFKNQTTLNDIHDVFAMRVVLPDKYNDNGEEQCDHLYSVLGFIHNKWRPLAQRFKDYVAVPKPNGYQSLHTAVLGLSPNSAQTTEIQLRTNRMHEEAEYGVASHWLYDHMKKKSDVNRPNTFSLENLGAEVSPTRKYVEWIDAIAKMQNEMNSGKDLMEALKIDVFTDRIFAMTPKGEVKDLPVGATPVDFAYSIHSDIGHRCQLAKVNGSTVPLDYHLKNGDVVEIMLQPKTEPKSAWLSFVKTASAKSKIRAYLRSLDKNKSFREGRAMLNKYLEKNAKPLLDDDLSIFREYGGKRFSVKDRISLVEEVGNGAVQGVTVLKKVYGSDFYSGGKRKSLREKKDHRSLFPKKKKIEESRNEIFISGEGGLPYRLANCCKPKVGLPIVGYVTRGQKITIHLQKCKLLKNADEERVLDASWGVEQCRAKYPVKINLLSKNRVGLIRDIAEVITSMNVNILFFSDSEKNGDVVGRDIVLEVMDDKQLNEIMEKLDRIRNVVGVKQSD